MFYADIYGLLQTQIHHPRWQYSGEVVAADHLVTTVKPGKAMIVNAADFRLSTRTKYVVVDTVYSLTISN